MFSRLRDKLVFFQRRILALEEEASERARQNRLIQDQLLLEKIELLDVLDNLPEFNPVAGLRIKRRTLRQLEDKQVIPIAFPDNKALIGKSKILETRDQAGLEPGTILSVVKTGYEHDGRVLRPAELITVL